MTWHQPLFALKKYSVLAGLAPGPPRRNLSTTYQATFANGGRGAGERCLEILTCHFPPCENAVAAEWASIKRKITLMCGKGITSRLLACKRRLPAWLKYLQQVEKENESSANKAISHGPLHVRICSHTHTHTHYTHMHYRDSETISKTQILCLNRKKSISKTVGGEIKDCTLLV